MSVLAMACGGEVASTDAGPCANNNAVVAGCSCPTLDVQVPQNAGFCVCKDPSSCSGPTWECFAFSTGCPAQQPASYSPCSDTTLKCDYVQSSAVATELTCVGQTWQPATIQTYCP